MVHQDKHTALCVVTGASGFIAGEIISQLLQKGYTVRATVRNLKDSHKVEHLVKLAETSPGVLTFHEAELGVPGAFDSTIKGANYVFHTAAPVEVKTFPEDISEREKLVDASVQSQLDILKAAAASRDTIKRVVITSSLAAVKPFEAWRIQPWTEEDWNTESSLEVDTYLYIKTITEKKSFEAAKELGLSLVSILPSFVIGPVMSDALNFSSTAVKGFLEGTYNSSYVYWLVTAVDVRDVALAHILAAENPKAKGRYLVAPSHPAAVEDMVEALQDRLPKFKLDMSKFQNPGYLCPEFQIFDTSKSEKELGLQITGMPESMSDMVVSMLHRNMIDLEPTSAAAAS